ncbi:MAG TPA: NADH-ubiquinone oxidoreductase-F iron-sulfur binding region domain-containing protein [Acidimicrobiales bacterium]
MTTLEAIRTRTARLLGDDAGWGTSDLGAHLRRHGPLALPQRFGAGWTDRLLDEIERSGLTGRGGAGFPSHRKLRLVRSAGPRSRPVLLVNAMEGEPASGKDRFLVGSSPHLVLDGAALVAGVLGAEKIVVCIPDDRPELGRILVGALRERDGAGWSSTPVGIRPLAGRYIAGEESALAAGVNGRPGVPEYRPDKSVPVTMGRTVTIVHNVETLAHVALIARHGADWFREVGTAEAPGTCLVTVSGAVERPGVVEVATGTPIDEIVGLAGPTRPVQAVLVGGYGGTWVSGEELTTPYGPGALRSVGGSMGAGVLVALPVEACGIRETERIARFMAAESAGQCGPCLFGLPALADDLRAIAQGTGGQQAFDRLLGHCEAVDGRGACRHPDGVVRLVRSALKVFAGDLAGHLRGSPCGGSEKASLLVLPPVGHERR